MTGSSHLRPLVVAAKAAALEAVRQVLAEVPGEFSVGVHRRLHSILPPTKYWPKEISEIKFSHGVDIAVLRLLPGQKSRKYAAAALDIVEDSDQGAAAVKRNVLGQVGIAYLALRPGKRRQTFESVLDGPEPWQEVLGRVLTSPVDPHLKWAFEPNFKEAVVESVLAERLAGVGLDYLEQVQLRDVIDLSESRDRSIRTRISDWNKSHPAKVSPNFSQMTDFDGVVCTPPPFSIPLLLVEVDGSVHRDPVKSDKREKDKLKNGIALDADIALARFAHGEDISIGKQENALRALQAVATAFAGNDSARLGTLLNMFSGNLESLPWHAADDIRLNFAHIQRTYTSVIRCLLTSREGAETDDHPDPDVRDTELDEQHELDSECQLLDALNSGVEEISRLYGEPSPDVQVTSEGSRIAFIYEPARWLPPSAPLPTVKSQLEIPAFKMIVPERDRSTVQNAIAAEFRRDFDAQFRSQLADYLGANKESLQQALRSQPQERAESVFRKRLLANTGHETRISKAIDDFVRIPTSPVPYPSSESEVAARGAAIARLEQNLCRAAAIVREVGGLDDESVALVIEDVRDRMTKKLAELEFRPFDTKEEYLKSTLR